MPLKLPDRVGVDVACRAVAYSSPGGVMLGRKYPVAEPEVAGGPKRKNRSACQTRRDR